MPPRIPLLAPIVAFYLAVLVGAGESALAKGATIDVGLGPWTASVGAWFAMAAGFLAIVDAAARPARSWADAAVSLVFLGGAVAAALAGLAGLSAAYAAMLALLAGDAAAAALRRKPRAT